MPNSDARDSKPKRSARRLAYLASAGVVVLCLGVFVLYHDALLGDYVKHEIIETVHDAHPEYTLSIDTLRYHMFRGRIDCAIMTMRSADSSVAWSLRALSIDGVGLFGLVFGDPLSRDNLEDVTVDAHDLHVVNSNTLYELRVDRVFASVPDSTIDVDSLRYHPTVDDLQPSDSQTISQSRYDLSIPALSLSGVDCGGLVAGKRLIARAIVLDHPDLGILINRDVERAPDTSTPRAPQERLAALEHELRIDSVRMTAGTLRYAEQIDRDSDPGVLTFDRVEARALNIMSRPDSADTMRLSAAAVFMNAGETAVDLAVPLRATDYSLRAHGSIGAMDLTQLNGYLVAAELKRVKAGDLYSASFDVYAQSGTAGGVFRAQYDNLDIQHLEGRNVVREVAIYMFHKFKLRKRNLANDGKSADVGVVAYTRRPTDRFIRFIWLSIRSGLGDLLGFH